MLERKPRLRPIGGVFACLLFAMLSAPLALAQTRESPGAHAGPRSSPAPAPVNGGGVPSPQGVPQEWPNEGWAARTAMASGRWAHASVSYSTGSFPDNSAYLFVISGYDAAFASSNRLSRYDVSAATWSDLAPVPTPVGQVSAARVGQRIFLPGGYVSAFSPTTTLQIYDIVANNWTTGAPLPQAVGDFALGVYQDRYVYVIGGYTGSGDVNLVQVYDTVQNTWAPATPKPGTAVAGLRGAIAGGSIVVTGGYSQTLGSSVSDTWVGVIDPMNPMSITWTAGPAYPDGTVGRLAAGAPVAAGPAAGTADLDVVLFTGGDPDGRGLLVESATWLFEVASGSWRALPAKPTAVSNINDFVGVASGGKLHMVSTGGYDSTQVVAVNEWLTLGVEGFADVALTLSDGDATVSPGGTVQYQVGYINNGPAAAEGVSLSATVPAGAAADLGNGTPGWSCAPDTSAGSVCTLAVGELAPGIGGNATFALTVLSPVPDGVTAITLQAGIATTTGEETTSNNTASETTPFTAGAIVVAPTSGLETSESGSTAQFQVSLTEEPLQSLTITLSSTNLGEGTLSTGTLVFAPADWAEPRTVVVTGMDDSADDGDVAYQITGSASGGGVNYTGATVAEVAAVNTDDDHLLTVNTVGNGSVTANPQSATYETGQQVILTATPAAGWTFAGWSGGASGSVNPLTLDVAGPTTITATFTQEQYPVTVTTVGSGSVAINPPGGVYTLGQSITLTATPAAGWTFAGWSGGASGSTNPLTLEVAGPTAITATFTQEQYPVTVTTVGSGSVAIDPPGGNYTLGQSITLTATPAAGWTFAGWSGGASGSTNPLTLEVAGPTAITATFTQEQYPVTVTTVGSGNVAIDPPGGNYTLGQSITLTATPAAGWTFAGWSGDASGNTNPLTLQVAGPTAITATFTQQQHPVTVTTVGSGSVAIDPPGGTYTLGQGITLTATPAAGWTFAGWSGGASGNTNPLTLQVAGPTAVTATFTRIAATLNLQTQGNGTIQVTPQQASYSVGDVITLNAVPTNGWFFAGWSGDVQSGANPLVVALQGDLTVVAAFGLANLPSPLPIPSTDWRGQLLLMFAVLGIAGLLLVHRRR